MVVSQEDQLLRRMKKTFVDGLQPLWEPNHVPRLAGLTHDISVISQKNTYVNNIVFSEECSLFAINGSFNIHNIVATEATVILIKC